MSYLVWKLLHVLGVILFVGNITTGILWKVHADRTRIPALIAPLVAVALMVLKPALPGL
jgi:uncharacterized membrane protein